METIDFAIEVASRRLVKTCLAQAKTIALAESCTGGMIATSLTAIPGASALLGFGFVTYSNQAKQDLLGVRQAELNTFGAVSLEVASAMARGALERTHSDMALAVTGIAGPAGGSPEKPVGTVCFALASRFAPPTIPPTNHGTPHSPQVQVQTVRQSFLGARKQVRQEATLFALAWLLLEVTK